MPTAAPRLRFRDVSLGVADQLVSSGTNLLALFLGAGLLSAKEFGKFAIMVTLTTLAVGVCNSLTIDWLRSAESPQTARSFFAGEAGLAVIFAAFVCGLAVAIAAMFGVGLPVLLLFPALSLHDFWRYAATYDNRGLDALGLDVIWLLGLCVGGVALGLSPIALNAQAMFGLWAGAAALALVVVMLWPRTAVTPPWVVALRRRDRGSLRPRLLLAADFVLMQASSTLLLVLVASFRTVEEAGGLRLAQSMLGPIYVVVAGLRLWLAPVISARRKDLEGLRRIGMVGLVTIPFAHLAIAGAMMLFEGPARQVLGEPARLAFLLLLPVAIGSGVRSGVFPIQLIFRIGGSYTELMRLRVIGVVALLAAVLVSVRWGSTVTRVAWLVALGSAISIVPWVVGLFKMKRVSESSMSVPSV